MIPDFTYDIFISYRQKDNKGERWVNKFVDALKTELEATFKDDISIYFDDNPDDRLKETHNVDKSLESKLKCLIFIPILSKTYCDPKSYAWQNELLTFVKLSSEDKIGKDVKLRNGNYASRILPVRINDLEKEDVNLFEKETGSKLRSMDFIFKTATGVNRPLRINEDHPNDNLNKTYYLDQINRLAIAISELYRGLNPERNSLSAEQAKNNQLTDNISRKNIDDAFAGKIREKSKRILVIISLMIFILAVGFALFKIINPGGQNSLTQIEKSIAVLPFVNDSPYAQNAYFINGIMDETLLNLQKIRDFIVLSRGSTERFRGNDMPAIHEIAKKIGVNYIVAGRGQKYGSKIVLRVQLIEAKNEKQLWGESYNRDIQATSDIINIQNEIAQAIAKELKSIMTPVEKQNIENKLSTNLTAYDFYLRAKDVCNEWGIGSVNREGVKKAEILFKKALEYDSTFALAYTGLAGLYWKKEYFTENISKNMLDSMLLYANKGLKYDSQLPDAYIIRAGFYAEKTGDLKKALEELDKAIDINPNSWEAYHEKAKYYEWSRDLVRGIENRQKAASLNHGPKLPELLSLIADDYYQAGFPEKANEFNLGALKLTGDSSQYLKQLASYESDATNFNKAIGLLIRISRIDSAYRDLDVLYGINYMFLGKYRESLRYYKRLVAKEEATGITPYFSVYNLIGYVLLQNGHKKEAESYFDRHIEFCNNLIKSKPYEQSIYANLELAGIYATRGEKAKAYGCLKIFNKLEKFSYSDAIRIKIDPLFSSIRNEPEFIKIESDVESKYQAEHERVSKWLTEQGLI